MAKREKRLQVPADLYSVDKLADMLLAAALTQAINKVDSPQPKQPIVLYYLAYREQIRGLVPIPRQFPERSRDLRARAE